MAGGGRMLVGIEPTASGAVQRDGARVSWQRFGSGPATVLLLPTWTIVHTDFWRHQVPGLARTFTVLTFDGLGNGTSDRPTDPAYYGDLLVARDAIAVMDAAGVGTATVMGVSQGGPWALATAALNPGRITAAVFIAANVPLAPPHPVRAAAQATFEEVLDAHEGWARWNRDFWLREYEDFLRFFFGQCFTEPGSELHIEHFVRMGLETTPEVLLASAGTEEHDLTPVLAADLAGRLRCPSLVIHGDHDAITPLARGTELARLAGSELVVVPGGGHEPQTRSPDVVNPLLTEFLTRIQEERR